MDLGERSPPKSRKQVIVLSVIIALVLVVSLATYAVLLRGSGVPGRTTKPPHSNQPPVASFVVLPANPYVGDIVTADASGSYDPDGTIIKYEWDWTSDGVYDATGVTSTHAYAAPGSYGATLRVTDNSSVTSMTPKSIAVVERPARVDILSNGMYIDSLGYAHVVGEVKWNGSYNIDFVEITATFRNASGQVVGVSFAFTEISILVPGERSPFEILQVDNVQWTVGYTLQVTDFRRTTHLPYRDFTVNGETMYTDSIGFVHVVGTVTNRGQSTARYVEVVATFRDAQGRAVATAFSFTSPTDLTAGSSGAFNAIHDGKDSRATIVSYEIQVSIFTE